LTIALSIALVGLGTLLPLGHLKHFSVERNWHKLIKPIQDSEAKRLQVLHGAKFMYIVLTLTAHCWFIFMPIFPLLYGQ
jgi:hypothetical protein